MAEAIVVEIREPGRAARRVPVTAAIEVGRDCRGLLIDDEAASRRHVVLAPAGDGGLVVTDLGSSNGTHVNGAQMSRGPRRIGTGDVLRLGETEIRIVARTAHEAETVTAVAVPPGPPRAAGPPPRAAPPVAEPAATGTPSRTRRRTGAVTLDARMRERLDAAHRWVEVETGGVEWARFLEAVLDAGLGQLPAVIARLREARSGGGGQGAL